MHQLIREISFEKTLNLNSATNTYEKLESSSSLLLDAYMNSGNSISSRPVDNEVPFSKREQKSSILYLSHFAKSIVLQLHLVIHEIRSSYGRHSLQKGNEGLSNYLKFLILRNIIFCSLRFIAIKNLEKNGKFKILFLELVHDLYKHRDLNCP